MYIFTMQYYSAIEGKILSFLATWMGPDIMLSKMSGAQEEKYHIL
jgi:hypothetical protein